MILLAQCNDNLNFLNLAQDLQCFHNNCTASSSSSFIFIGLESLPLSYSSSEPNHKIITGLAVMQHSYFIVIINKTSFWWQWAAKGSTLTKGVLSFCPKRSWLVDILPWLSNFRAIGASSAGALYKRMQKSPESNKNGISLPSFQNSMWDDSSRHHIHIPFWNP